MEWIPGWRLLNGGPAGGDIDLKIIEKFNEGCSILAKDLTIVYKAVLTFVLSKGEISGEAEEILSVLREQLGLGDDDHNAFVQEISSQMGGKKKSPRSIKIRNYIHVGQSAYKREDYQQALKYFNEALKIEENHKEALFFKKQCLNKLGDDAPSEEDEMARDGKGRGKGRSRGDMKVPARSPYSNAAKELLEPLCSTCGDTGECKWCKGKGACVWCRGSGKCRSCNGTGKVDGERCTRCDGSGKCNTCNGRGECYKCKGTARCQVCNI